LRILVTGATGLIGSAVVSGLSTDGHEVAGVARNVDHTRRSMPQCHWHALDVAAASLEDWAALMVGVEAVVNCAGALQDSASDSLLGVHQTGAQTLFVACERAGVRRFIQISAIGVDRGTPTAFSQTKSRGDDALMRSSLEWVVLRPSIVIAQAAFGGSALFRGLAALPVLPIVPGTGALQTVQIGDLIAAVRFFLAPDAPTRHALDITAPQDMSFAEIVAIFRRWLGWHPARLITMPAWMAGLMFNLGDFAGYLGWKPPVRSNAIGEIARGAVGDSKPWTLMTGIAPRSLAEALASEPASVQERWFAGLYLLKPMVVTVLALFWLATGVIALGPGYAAGLVAMQGAGGGSVASAAVIGGALADITIGVAIAWRRTSRLGLLAALALSVVYLIAGTILDAGLWLEPLGAFVKILPILALHLAALAMLESR
jgi:uncharacterized protein YbjT (DUF2867 family)